MKEMNLKKLTIAYPVGIVSAMKNMVRQSRERFDGKLIGFVGEEALRWDFCTREGRRYCHYIRSSRRYWGLSGVLEPSGSNTYVQTAFSEAGPSFLKDFKDAVTSVIHGFKKLFH